MERHQKKAILKDLQKKMVLLSGPRQAGKTTLAKMIADEHKSSVYLTYDRLEDRKIILDEGWLESTELIILDEIHKMPKWKNYLKGVFDTKPSFQKILVTGSARLEVFNRVGDSLAGRYFLHRLLPLSPAECEKVKEKYTIDKFLQRGGFPEPFLAESLIYANRWRLQYVDSLLRVDVLDFENIHNLNAIKLLFEMLKEKVGSPISYSSIAGDLAISPHTVKKYIQILEALYIVFRVTPFSKNIARSLLKEPKIYFFDNGLVKGNVGIKFENLVASCLLKHVLSKIDYKAENYSLNYLHTKEHHEVDFALVKDAKIEKIIEVKNRNNTVSKSLYYFKEKYNLKAFQVVKELKREKMQNGIKIMKGINFLKDLE
ncbi:MAG: Holliday junction ATP-dependent DNA helicase RuvB [Candidatus Anoxychlamydiales bacterium]|nr:Holliday junction ATP-dependent DNA helicase RuvB [Candidatus Anoxychlamydiales bacterium]